MTWPIKSSVTFNLQVWRIMVRMFYKMVGEVWSLFLSNLQSSGESGLSNIEIAAYKVVCPRYTSKLCLLEVPRDLTEDEFLISENGSSFQPLQPGSVLVESRNKLEYCN